jgi:hypothetical protein
MKEMLSKFNPSSLFRGNSNTEPQPCVPQKCKPTFTPEEKKKRMLIEYCKIISKNQQYIEHAFQKSFEQYSSQLTDNLNTNKFMDKIQEIIMNYLIEVFNGNKFTQKALLMDLKPIITEKLKISINFSKDEPLNSDDIYKKFMENLRGLTNNYRTTTKAQIGGAGPNEQSSISKNVAPATFTGVTDKNPSDPNPPAYPLSYSYTTSPQPQLPIENMQEYVNQYMSQNMPLYMQQYVPLYMQQYMPVAQPVNPSNELIPQAQPINSSDEPKNDDIQALNEVVEFFKKDTDKDTVNQEILDIIETTITKVLEKRKNEIYAPLIDVLKQKIKLLISDIGSINGNLKITMLIHMLENGFYPINAIIREMIENIISVMNDPNNKIENFDDIINNAYNVRLIENVNASNKTGGGRKKRLKSHKTKKSRKSRKSRKQKSRNPPKSQKTQKNTK